MKPFALRRTLAGIATLAVSCIAPSDQSGDYRVLIEPIPDLFVGDTIQATARVIGADGREVRGVAIVFGTSDPTVATVSPEGLVVATGIGSMSVLARAPGLANATLGKTLSVAHGAVEIDSVLPGRVRYGSHLLLYGVGLDPASAAIATTSGVVAPVAFYSPADPAHPEQYGVLEVVIAPPLGQNSDGVTPIEVPITVTTTRGVASVSATFVVEPRDIYEPNDSVPANLGVITGRFEALGLAYDKLDPSEPSLPVDWYTFTTVSQGDWTITLRSVAASQGFPSAQIIEGPLAYTGTSIDVDGIPYPLSLWYLDRPSLPAVGTQESCYGFAGELVDPLDPQNPGFYPNEVGWSIKWPHVRWALKDLPAGTHHLLLGFNNPIAGWPLAPGTSVVDGIFRSALATGVANQAFDPIRYDLIIEPGVHTDVPPDRLEGNDFCENAPTLLSLGLDRFADSLVDGLTIDAEFDYDWFVVKAQTPGRLYLTVESDDPDRKPSPVLLSPAPDVGQPVTRMSLEGYGKFNEGQELLSNRDFSPGVSLEARSYYLLIRPGQPRSYRLRFAWIPGAPAPAASH